MGIIMKDGHQYGIGGIGWAEDVSYDNTESGMTATDVQGALDELSAGLMKYPDYSSSGILYNFSTSAVTLNYTATEDCYMNIHVINTSAASLSVNGVAIASSARAGDYYQLSYAGYLKAGDTVTSSGVVRGIILKLR